MKSRNAKFLENDIISESDLPRNIVPKQNNPEPSTSNDRLVITHNTSQVQPGVKQPIITVPQIVENDLENQITQELLETVEQSVEQHASSRGCCFNIKKIYQD